MVHVHKQLFLCWQQQFLHHPQCAVLQTCRLAARASRSPHLLNMCRLTTYEHIKEKQFSHNILVGFTDTVCIVWDIFASFNVLNVFCCPHATVNRGWSVTNQTFNLPSTAGISYFHY